MINVNESILDEFKILKEISDKFPLAQRVIAQLALRYGLRVSEIFEIELKDINSVSRKLIILGRLRSGIGVIEVDEDMAVDLSSVASMATSTGPVFRISRYSYERHIVELFEEHGLHNMNLRILRQKYSIVSRGVYGN